MSPPSARPGFSSGSAVPKRLNSSSIKTRLSVDQDGLWSQRIRSHVDSLYIAIFATTVVSHAVLINSIAHTSTKPARAIDGLRLMSSLRLLRLIIWLKSTRENMNSRRRGRMGDWSGRCSATDYPLAKVPLSASNSLFADMAGATGSVRNNHVSTNYRIWKRPSANPWSSTAAPRFFGGAPVTKMVRSSHFLSSTLGAGSASREGGASA